MKELTLQDKSMPYFDKVMPCSSQSPVKVPHVPAHCLACSLQVHRSNCEEHALVVPVIFLYCAHGIETLFTDLSICQMFLCKTSMPTTYHPIALLEDRDHCLFD